MGRLCADPVIHLLLRLALATLFAAAAAHKLRDLGAFAATLRNYRLLPGAAAPVLAPLFAAVEIVLALALLAGFGWAPLAAAALLLLYSGAIAVNLGRGRRDVDCGCLGPRRRQPLSEWLLARNALLVAAALCLRVPERARPLHWADAVTLVAALVFVSICWVSANLLLETWPRLRPLRWQS